MQKIHGFDLKIVSMGFRGHKIWMSDFKNSKWRMESSCVIKHRVRLTAEKICRKIGGSNSVCSKSCAKRKLCRIKCVGKYFTCVENIVLNFVCRIIMCSNVSRSKCVEVLRNNQYLFVSLHHFIKNILKILFWENY